VEFEDGEDAGREEDGPLFALLPPADRLWRHPSEVSGDLEASGLVLAGRDARDGATLVRPTAKVWFVALAAGLAGALIASGFFLATGITDRRTTVVEPVVTPNTVALANAPSTPPSAVGDWPSIANALAASIVAVRVSSAGNLQVGSGVLYAVGDDESYILTAEDLVPDGGRVTVAFTTGLTAQARIVGRDPVTGIAVLATPGTHRSFPTFGSVSNVEIAEQVLAVGSRLANSSPVAGGTVSGLDQEVTTADNDDSMIDMLALSGITVPEASDGGALVDPDGDVVGIDTDITSTDPSAEGVAYAVPIDVAEHVARQLLSGVQLTHPWLGVDDATDLASSAAAKLGVSGGAEVGSVAQGSPAASIGLEPYDVITRLDGQAVTSSGALVTLLAQLRPGERASLTFFRQDKRSTVRVAIDEQPAGV
jgi:S1-C subfamily serine protease